MASFRILSSAGAGVLFVSRKLGAHNWCVLRRSRTHSITNLKLQALRPAAPLLCRFASSSPMQETSQNDVLVYEGPLRTKIKVVKYISISSSALGLFLQPIILYDLAQINTALAIMCSFVSALFLSSPYLLHILMKRYVIELWYEPRSKIFTAKTFTLFNRIKETRFTADDVSVPALPGILSSFHVRKTPLFVDVNLVHDVDAYSHMMGYDKPLNLTLNPESGSKSNTNV